MSTPENTPVISHSVPLIVAPANIGPNWEEECTKYGVKLIYSPLAPSVQPVQPVSVVLKPHQITCYKKLSEYMSRRISALLCAPTGTGKTIACIKLAKDYGLNLFVVGPANIGPNWEEECTKYGVKLTFISYSLLAGKSGVMNHPYINVHNGDYYASETFKQHVASGILLVYDECQSVKKITSISSQVCYALSYEVKRQNQRSRIILSSGTPFDKEIFAESMFKLMAIIRQKELFFYNVGYNEYQMDGYGYEEAENYCNQIDPVLTAACYPARINAKQIRMSLYNLFVNVVKQRSIFTMPRPKINAKFIPVAGYYTLEEPALSELNIAIRQLHRAARKENGEIGFTSGNMGAITKAFVAMEKAKVPLFHRLLTEQLEKDPNCKVVLYVWHDDTIDKLLQSLSKYNPLRCDGKVQPPAKRDKLRLLFQQPNNQYRVILAKATAFGVGINLDDTNGNFPRHVFINPHYYFDKIHQGAGRIYRTCTESDAHCYLTYIKNTDEHSIVQALYRKTDVTKSIVFDTPSDEENTTEEAENLTIFPADYPIRDM